MKKISKMVTDTVICNALYLLFIDFCECVIESEKDWKTDENDVNYRYAFRMRYKACEKEETIRKLWGSRCQYLLSGIFIYLYKLDEYFNPKLNGYEEFFIKLYRHREILTKIGSGNHKVIFPFIKLINKKKKPLLIRC